MTRLLIYCWSYLIKMTDILLMTVCIILKHIHNIFRDVHFKPWEANLQGHLLGVCEAYQHYAYKSCFISHTITNPWECMVRVP